MHLARRYWSFEYATAAVALVAVLVYATAMRNGFAYDDQWIVQQNARVHQLRDLHLIWGTPYWPTFGKELGLYRPLTIFLFAIEWFIGQGAPWVFHASNAILHSVASVLALLLLREIVKDDAAAFAGALIFAVHPVHTEAVANIVGQSEVLSGIGIFGACLYHARRSETRTGWGRAIVTTLIFAFALFAKEGAIVLPVLLVLVDFVQRRVQFKLRSIGEYVGNILPLIATCGAFVAAYLVVRGNVLGNITGSDVAPSYPFLYGTHRVLNGFRAWPEYVRLLFFPQDLSADYSPGVILPVESLTPLAILGLVLLGTTIVSTFLVDRYTSAFASGWFLISILPVSNLLYTIGVVVAERTLYVPSFAVSVAIACLYQYADRRGVQHRLLNAGVLVVIVLMSVRVITRNPEWKNTRTIMEVTLRDHPESYRAQWSEAVRAFSRSDTSKAEEHWLYAYRIWPRDSQFLTELGAFQMTMKRYDLGYRLLMDAHKLHPGVPRTEQILALCALNAGHFADALAAVDRSIRMIGPSSYLFDIRARALMGLGRNADAVPVWEATIRQPNGNTWMQWNMLGRALASSGKTAAAAKAFDTAIARAGKNSAAAGEIQRTRKQYPTGASKGD